MRVTIKKIAEVAGVSRGTVDRALNERPGVKKDVADRIKKIANGLGYKPNPAAKALADKRYVHRKMGILLISEGNPFFDEVRRGVDAALVMLEEFGMESTIRTMKGYSVETQLRLLDELAAEDVNGIVLTPVNAEEVVEKIKELKDRGIEVVTVNSDVLGSGRMAYVGCKIKKSGNVAAGLIGMMNCGKEERYAIIGSSVKNLAVKQRIQGIEDTLKQDYPWISVTDILETEDSDEIAYQKVSELLDRRDDLSGICFAGAGHEGGIEAILHKKRKLKIVAFDLTDAVRKFLKNDVVSAVVCQEPYKQGYDAVEIMGKYLIWNQRPEREMNLTEISIVTKYSV